MWMPFGVCCGLVGKLGIFYCTPYYKLILARSLNPNICDRHTHTDDTLSYLVTHISTMMCNVGIVVGACMPMRLQAISQHSL